ncbi:lysophospholipid acyltransferase family protein [Actinocorallia sp. A-T 12471]|uniref:lysophospholipid acyltransferase family protein n=1 Tax=Actinocorallia sp. A-T 12471 TaxID=3089813 RepID=UPI0029CF8102|nr:1-acyl-sn-glycerol-3-phosphate acyltransferase [Actinocorallia sp. A-T 12471]MDX6745011.1 1-acyl-sn-glycerol-3-phosphate acyltransferase [Actinocorallia sp. A-T 12471]
MNPWSPTSPCTTACVAAALPPTRLPTAALRAARLAALLARTPHTTALTPLSRSLLSALNITTNVTKAAPTPTPPSARAGEAPTLGPERTPAPPSARAGEAPTLGPERAHAAPSAHAGQRPALGPTSADLSARAEERPVLGPACAGLSARAGEGGVPERAYAGTSARAGEGGVFGVGEGGGVLVVANHVSWLDVPVLASLGAVTMLAKREVGEWPVIGELARRVGTRFIDRDGLLSLPGVVADLAELLRAGSSVVVFPEGTTRCRTPGRFHRAVFQAALDARAPILPVALSYRQGPHPTTLPAYVGADPFSHSLRRVLTAAELSAHVHVHAPLYPSPSDTRRTLALRTSALLSPGGSGQGTGVAAQGMVGGDLDKDEPDAVRVGDPHLVQAPGL